VECSEAITVKAFLEGKGVSRRLMTKLKRQINGITCNGEHIRTVDMVKNGDEIVLAMQDVSFLEPNPSLNVPIVYESDSVVVFDKPIGMPVHPSIKHQGDTLGNYFAYLYPDLTFRPVNRLDRDTSGLCAVVKNAYAASMMKLQKIYYAVACGIIKEDGMIDAPIDRVSDSIILRCVSPNGKRAVTHYKVIKSSDKYTLIEVRLETGRTHQIRVHFSYIGHPLVGDELYGRLSDEITGQALHCGKLRFFDVSADKDVEVVGTMRKEMLNLF
jgi:23S rRNA pseudouridine1911/1915/1917 synthase